MSPFTQKNGSPYFCLDCLERTAHGTWFAFKYIAGSIHASSLNDFAEDSPNIQVVSSGHQLSPSKELGLTLDRCDIRNDWALSAQL